jgi:hypothetical protein
LLLLILLQEDHLLLLLLLLFPLLSFLLLTPGPQVYEGLYAMSIRDFTLAAKLFLDAISTFTSYELMDYVKFVEYTVWISVLALDRSDLHKVGRSQIRFV